MVRTKKKMFPAFIIYIIQRLAIIYINRYPFYSMKLNNKQLHFSDLFWKFIGLHIYANVFKIFSNGKSHCIVVGTILLYFAQWNEMLKICSKCWICRKKNWTVFECKQTKRLYLILIDIIGLPNICFAAKIQQSHLSLLLIAPQTTKQYVFCLFYNTWI